MIIIFSVAMLWSFVLYIGINIFIVVVIVVVFVVAVVIVGVVKYYCCQCC